MELASSTGTSTPEHGQSQNNLFALTALTSLFFMWGFITCLNDILIPHLKNVFSLSYTQAMLIQFCFFGAYFLVSIPAGMLIKRIGYKYGIVLGLIIAGVGCLLFYPAATTHVYGVFLGALFVLASGITILQVSANPYVAILGPSETAASRLTLTQAFNSLGTAIAPFFGAALILSVAAVDASQMHASQLETVTQAEASSVQIPYLLLAATLLVLAAIFAMLKLPAIEYKPVVKTASNANQPSIFTYRHLTLGALGIFLYVGAEVSIGSFMVNFLGKENIANMAEAEAANYVAYYWAGAMVGRFIGAAVMQKVSGGVVLAFNASLAVGLLLIAILGQGWIAMWSILLIGLCNSIMFPVIFSLGVNQLGERTSEGSGILCLAIAGGAIVPLAQGFLADSVGLQPAFILPLLCYLYIVFYGLKGSKPTFKLT
ncbi:L-fucose-proton symporter [Paraglaciecola mesophila]|uniref:L-fucose-proton symporter n=1 Tax=Paraglaciecola mesophila TaxID=197222 RepID=A0A857JPU5_9ALTE|nr:sugar MFS transporter [Paraglaciecola mesophila]QHJ13081.1 L-fucose-proton symporter [Paraglaciecola mesophila]